MSYENERDLARGVMMEIQRATGRYPRPRRQFNALMWFSVYCMAIGALMWLAAFLGR